MKAILTVTIVLLCGCGREPAQPPPRQVAIFDGHSHFAQVEWKLNGKEMPSLGFEVGDPNDPDYPTHCVFRNLDGVMNGDILVLTCHLTNGASRTTTAEVDTSLTGCSFLLIQEDGSVMQTNNLAPPPGEPIIVI